MRERERKYREREGEKEIKDKVNRLVDVGASNIFSKGKKKCFVGKERKKSVGEWKGNKKGFSRDYQRNCMFEPFTQNGEELKWDERSKWGGKGFNILIYKYQYL